MFKKKLNLVGIRYYRTIDDFSKELASQVRSTEVKDFYMEKGQVTRMSF